MRSAAASKTPPTRGAVVRSAAILGGIGIALIVVAVVASGHAVRGALGTLLGVGFLLCILRLGYVNRGDNTKTRQGMPVWAAGIGLFAVAVGIISSELGAGHGFILGVIGGVLFSYGVSLVVVPRVLFGDRQGIPEKREE